MYAAVYCSCLSAGEGATAALMVREYLKSI
jgi:hypothetical protein